MLKYFIIIFFFFAVSLYAEIVQKIELRGNDRISVETVKVYGGIDLNKNYSSADLNEILKKLYTTNFFEDIKISLKNNVLLIDVKEYAVINNIEFRGEKAEKLKKKVLEILQLKSKESFIENKLTEDISTIKKIYGSMGFNFTNVEAKIEKFSNNRINLIYFLDKGKKTKITKINFTGDKKIREKRLRDIIASEEDKFWKILSKNTSLNYNNIELDKRLLLSYYRSLGYYDVQVLSNNAEVGKNNFTNLTYTINAGTRYRVNKVSTNVSDGLDKKAFIPLKKNFTKIIGKYYSPLKVKKILDDLDTLVINNDLQFIEHSVNEIIDGDGIEVRINIFESNKLLVEKINIIGNTVTDEAVIRAELLLDEGDPFNSLKLSRSIAKLKGRNLFSSVEEKTSVGSNKDLKIVEISVEEKPTGEISAGAGVGTNGASFAFQISENNWLGRGINVNTSLNMSAETFTGGVSINDPNYKFSGNSINYFVTNSSNDKPNSGYKNNLISTGLGTQFEQYKNIYLSPSLSFNYDDLNVESTASKALQKQEGTFSDLSFDYGISLDNRDRAYAPSSGYISSFNQTLPVYADTPFIKNSFTFSKYHTFSPNAIGTFKFYTAAINGLDDKDVRISKRIIMPSNRLRGFKSGQIGPVDGVDYIGGNYAAATNFEVALPTLLPEAARSEVALFLDFGNLWEVDYDKTINDTNKIRSSAGVATSWNSPVGAMSFIFSRNIAKASTDITEGFNFKLGTAF